LLLSLAILNYRQYFIILQTLKLNKQNLNIKEIKFGRIDSKFSCCWQALKKMLTITAENYLICQICERSIKSLIKGIFGTFGWWLGATTRTLSRTWRPLSFARPDKTCQSLPSSLWVREKGSGYEEINRDPTLPFDQFEIGDHWRLG
jgi:hypothetical protein